MKYPHVIDAQSYKTLIDISESLPVKNLPTLDIDDQVVINEMVPGFNLAIRKYNESLYTADLNGREIGVSDLQLHNTIVSMLNDLPEWLTVFATWTGENPDLFKNMQNRLFIFDVYDANAGEFLGVTGAANLDVLPINSWSYNPDFEMNDSGKGICVSPILYRGMDANVTTLKNMYDAVKGKSMFRKDGEVKGLVITDLDSYRRLDDGSVAPLQIAVKRNPKPTDNLGSHLVMQDIWENL